MYSGDVTEVPHFFAFFLFPAFDRSLPCLAWAVIMVLHRRYAPPSWRCLLLFNGNRLHFNLALYLWPAFYRSFSSRKRHPLPGCDHRPVRRFPEQAARFPAFRPVARAATGHAIRLALKKFLPAGVNDRKVAALCAYMTPWADPVQAAHKLHRFSFCHTITPISAGVLLSSPFSSVGFRAAAGCGGQPCAAAVGARRDSWYLWPQPLAQDW